MAQFQTNFFSVAKLTKAILPHFRKRGTGTVVFIGSKAGWAGMPGVEAYCCSKFALEGTFVACFISMVPFENDSNSGETSTHRRRAIRTIRTSTGRLLI
jgi:hypothetical protein